MAGPSWIGRTLGGRYQIESLLGQGGMSAVYRGTDPNLRRTVAIKLIHSHLSGDPQFVSRFEEEAASVAQLKHTNIIQVFDFNHDGDTYYMVMEYVPGETLQERLKKLNDAGEKMDFQQVARISAGICDALEYAHRQALIHRDIKPANVMLDPSNQAILMDFGIAKIVGGKSHTATGAVVGTALYLSPEQIRGEDYDRGVDIYALGVTLFEMLSGKPPFESDSAMSTMMMHLNDPVPHLRTLRPDVPPDLIAITERALSKSRAERFQTASEMALALRGADLDVDLSTGYAPTSLDSIPAATEFDASERTVQPPATAVDPLTAIDTPLEATHLDTQPPASAPLPATRIEPEPQASGAPLQPTRIESETVAAGGRMPPPPSGSAQAAKGATPRTGGGSRRGLLIGSGIVLLLVCLLASGALALAGLPGLRASPVPTTEVAVVVPSETSSAETPSAETPSAETPSPTATEALPSDTPEPTLTPTQTDPAGPYARINEIRLENGRYIVEYETFGYTEQLPGMHVHFFFDHIPPIQAGVPDGSGEWFLWGGPRPFNAWGPANRPAAASQMCALVANSDHSVIQETGNCMLLPES